ncbi:MAG: FMN-binding protein [Flavobacteriales bacterium]|nr:FMN-binding protein [Flavobacteriales bacterium]
MNEDLSHMEVEQQEPGSFRLIFTLGFAGFLSGLILVSAYLFTLPYINQNKADALQKAVFEVLPGTRSFQTLVLVEGKLVQMNSDPGDQPVIYQGFDSLNKSTGFAVPGAIAGFQDIISGIYGFDPVQQQIIGFRVLDSKETPGLGDKIYKDASFAENFIALQASSDLEPVKPGQKTLDHQVETITGATISSKAVVNLLNNSLNQWRGPIEGYMNNLSSTNK